MPAPLLSAPWSRCPLSAAARAAAGAPLPQVDDVSIPVGDIAPVQGSPFDFTSPHTVGERIDQVPGDRQGWPAGRLAGRLAGWKGCTGCCACSDAPPATQLAARLPLHLSACAAAGPAPGGYDHNWVLFGLGPDAKDKCHGGMASET